jgi:hypothetical protein
MFYKKTNQVEAWKTYYERNSETLVDIDPWSFAWLVSSARRPQETCGDYNSPLQFCHRFLICFLGDFAIDSNVYCHLDND